MKRKNGEGSWGTKTIKGKKYKYFRDANGKYTYGKTDAEIKEKIKKAKRHETISVKSEVVTIQEYMLNWLSTTRQKRLKQQTYDNYEIIIQNYLDLAGLKFGSQNIKSLTYELTQRYVDTLAEQYSLGTIRKVWSVVRQCLRYGMARYELPHFDMSLIQMPSEENVAVKAKDVPFATVEDIEALYQEAFRKKDGTVSMSDDSGCSYMYGNNARAVIIIMYAGLRISELCALKWGNVDMANRCIKVEYTHAITKNRDKNARTKTKVVTSLPKTYNQRTVPLSKRAYEQFEFFARLNPNHTPDDYVCITKNNTAMSRRNIYRTLKQMLSRCDANKDLTPHALRHGFGSVLLKNGVEIKTISELMGHKDIRTTYNIYIGITEQQKFDAISTLDL